MSYFVFAKNEENVDGAIYRIAENENDLNNLNIVFSSYKIIEDSLENFNEVKFGTKNVAKYENNSVVYEIINTNYIDSNVLTFYLNNIKKPLQNFLNTNPNHPSFNNFQNYYTQLNNFDVNSVQYPLQISLEKYFNNLQLPSYHPLQIP